MNTQANQELRSSNGLLGLVILGLSLFLILPLGLDSAENSEVARNQKKAESLAYQIITIQQNQNSTSSTIGSPNAQKGDRGPASVAPRFHQEGSIGLDQWGRPFQYKMFEHLGKKHIAVWSYGPNGKLDSSVEDNNLSATNTFKGDDIGVVITTQ
jgi:hypothetical protein